MVLNICILVHFSLYASHITLSYLVTSFITSFMRSLFLIINFEGGASHVREPDKNDLFEKVLPFYTPHGLETQRVIVTRV